MISKNKKQNKRKIKIKSKRKNPKNISANKKIAIDYIITTAELIYRNAKRSMRDLSIDELDDIVNRIYKIQNDLNLIGLRKPSYLEEEPKKIDSDMFYPDDSRRYS